MREDRDGRLPGATKTVLVSALGALWIATASCDGSGPVDEGSDDGIDRLFSMGVGLSPRGHTSGSTDQDWIDHYSGHAPWGRIIAFHGNWRDGLASSGQVPELAIAAVAAADEYGFTPVIGLGWTGGDGEPDLTSESAPEENSWANQETRGEFLSMVTALAREDRPPYLFLGNETNAYYRTHSAEDWELWLSEYDACYDSIKAVSANTVVFTTFHYEMLQGAGRHNGWTFPADWRPVDDFVGAVRADALGFTSYPYFEYDTPGDIPEDYYDEIGRHWNGPVIFTEIGWLGGPSGPYAGGQEDQAGFVSRFFALSRNLELRYVVWLFLHDWDGQESMPAFRFIGLRVNDGTPRLGDAAWRAEVTSRE
jgi:hypothetical protein